MLHLAAAADAGHILEDVTKRLDQEAFGALAASRDNGFLLTCASHPPFWGDSVTRLRFVQDFWEMGKRCCASVLIMRVMKGGLALMCRCFVAPPKTSSQARILTRRLP